jgi:hypothetical protein
MKGMSAPSSAFLGVIVVVAAVIGVGAFIGGTSQNVSTTFAGCGNSTFLTRLASQVEAQPRFTSESHGLVYALAYGDNQSGTTGQANGRTYSAPPETGLAFYSYGTGPDQPCPEVQGLSGVVGALWVRVPINPDKSYNLSGMTVYFTPGVFVNGTSVQSGDNSTGSNIQPCLNPSGSIVQQFGGSSANSSEPGELAIVLQTGSSATVCVKYAGDTYSPEIGLVTLKPSVFVETCSQMPGGGGSCGGTAISSVTVTSSPQSVEISNGTDSIVEYTITANANSKGFYLFSTLYSCPAILLAVGYQTSQLVSSDFPGMGPTPCPAPVVQVEILGISGANTTYVGY